MTFKFYFLWVAYSFGNPHAFQENVSLKYLKGNLNETDNVLLESKNNSIQLNNDLYQKMRYKVYARHPGNILMTQTDSDNCNSNCNYGNSISENKSIIVCNKKDVSNMKTNSEKPCIKSMVNSSDYEKSSDTNKYYDDDDDGYDEYYDDDGKLVKENEKYNESKPVVKENENDGNKIIINFKTPDTSEQNVKPNSLFIRINKGNSNYIERDNVSRLVNSAGSKCIKKIVNHLSSIINEVLSNNCSNSKNIMEENFHIRNLGEKNLVKDHTKYSGKKRRGTKMRRKAEKLNKQKWTEWSDWSMCSVSCGRGRSVRWRTCIHPECFDSVRYEMEQVPCQLPDCPPFSFKFFNGI